MGKMRDYPVMGIPHYLIVDPRNGTGTRREFAFGETVEFAGYEVATADFPVY
ncbi:hypothetical protein ABT095_08685 [Kitasatospora sp. NPDC002227]|uniref:hypothetical protein n=1 Tax=Kitasatospora sp. NPDC002227 TaxID=3154773 RepID=UPI00332C8235